MFTQRALPILISLLPSTPTNTMLTYRTTGLGESAIEALLGESLLNLGIEVGYCARLGEVDLRLIGPAATLHSASAIITSRLGSHLVSKENLSLESVVLNLLIAARQTLSTAESCTGGLLAHRLTNPPGASAAFTQSFVTYSNQAKHHTLGISTELLESAGPVSAPVATAMAEAARHLASTDYALATTGFAGPTGGTPTEPLGTVFIALASPHLPTVVERHRFHADRESVKILATQAALDLLRRSLLLHPPS
jgi:nicotinamide-nucleotide amidase